MKQTESLTERQLALHAALWMNRGKWLKSKEIYNLVPGYESEATAYKEINADVHALNMSGEFSQKAISSRVLGYKLATRDEYWDWAERTKREAIKMLGYVSAMSKDAKLDGQITLPGFGGKTIRVFVEDAR